MPSLPEFLETFDRSSLQSRVTEANDERARLLAMFPPEDMASMTLEHYALGQGEQSHDSLCYQLEFASDALGSIRGGSSGKFVLYWGKEGKWISKLPREPDPERAWQRLHTDLVQAIRLGDEGRWEELDALPAACYIPAARTKLMYLYFPEDVLPIYAQRHLVHFLGKLGQAFSGQGGDRYAASANRQLLETLRAMPELAGWSTMEIALLLYEWSPPSKPSRTPAGPPDEGPRLMKIAPGERAKHWDECLAGGFVCIGWDEMGDLLTYPDFDAFLAGWQEVFPKAGGTGRSHNEWKAQEMWQLRDLRAGDLIAANRGTSEILAVGTVLNPPYEWSPTRSVMRHLVHVKWDTAFARKSRRRRSGPSIPWSG